MNEVNIPVRMPWDYGRKIARATGYSRKTVYAVKQGLHRNEKIERLLSLAISDRLAFAQALEREVQAQRILETI